MNISYNWLKEFLNFNLSPEETAKALTSIGLENGPVEAIETIKGGLEGLVVGQVLTCLPHPDSDHLHVTTVDLGTGEPLQIVCGAPNVKAGQKVVVATVGTRLYSGEDSFVIKRSKIRGQESVGMICAEDEIGIGSSHEGIIVVPEGTQVGLKASDYYKVQKEYVLEVDITPNRADAASHYGVARDLAASLKIRDSSVQLTRPSVSDFKIDNRDYPVEVTVENPEACSRYAGITLTGITVGESPDWLKNRLKLIGVRPINNVVDVTNYMLHETGQPLHAFDGDKITGNAIRVKTVEAGTTFTTLDGVDRKLDADDLMICNLQGPMCIGGVFGGLDSGVSDSTTRIFIESALFNPVFIRKTARRHGLNTDASFRFERGVDPDNIIYALKRAALMIQSLAGGLISSDVVDIYPVPVKGFTVPLNLDKVNRLIGKSLEPESVKSILAALDIEILAEKGRDLDLLVPAYRVDVQRDVDVIEDILRIYGYNNVEFTSTIKSTISASVKPDNHRLQNLIAEQLTAVGFNEIMNNSLTAESYYQDLETYKPIQCVHIINPLSQDLNVMRQTLLFGGLESIAYNKNRRHPDLKLYEFGNCYQYAPVADVEVKPLSAYKESMHLGLWMSGFKRDQHWNQPLEKVTIYDLKAAVESVFIRLGIKRSHYVLTEGQDELFHHFLTYSLRNGSLLAKMGAVSSKCLSVLDLDSEVFYADIQWNTMMNATKKLTVQFEEVPKYPEVRRDLALLIDQSVRFDDIERIALATEKKLLKSVTLFDVFEGKNLPAGKKSYAVSFKLQDLTQTLTDQRIEAIMSNLTKNFEQQLGALLR
jgi:phenylalanyl-tRNA synthetase beta chain